MAKKMGLSEADLSDVRAEGWLKRYLDTQAAGMTGRMDGIDGPFDRRCWGNPNARKELEGYFAFLGGMGSYDPYCWTAFEQTGYWIDGMIRCGYLTDNRELTEKAKKYVYDTIDRADADGYLGPEHLKHGMTWAHAVFLRSVVAEYTASHNPKILDALTKHFLQITVKETLTTERGACNTAPLLGVRNIATIETALWLYGQTGDERLLGMVKEGYDYFNAKYYDDSTFSDANKSRDLTVRGMLRNRKVHMNHGVTYNEICKIAAIMYQYTGEETYRQAAVNAFEKLYRDQVLIDGVNCSTEYLNKEDTSLDSHETCDVSDFTWAVGYIYMITADGKYGDWIEDAVFNGGLGSVDDDFTSNQYFSCPNQVICDDTSNHNKFFRGEPWMSFAPEHVMCCCAGNVHRFMPNYVARSWMNDGADGVYATLYGPSSYRATVRTKDGDKEVRFTEETDYPYGLSVKITVDCPEKTACTLYLRNPGWSVKTTVKVNGRKVSAKETKGFLPVKREYAPGDVIEVSFEAELKLIENAKGVSVKYGPLLYALPVGEKVVVEGLRSCGNPDFPHYSLYPESKWNYGLDLERAKSIRVTHSKPGGEPWRKGCGGTEIQVPVREVLDWKVRRYEHPKTRDGVRGHMTKDVGHPCTLLTAVRAHVKEESKGGRETVTLIPYGSTRLRIAIFPKV